MIRAAALALLLAGCAPRVAPLPADHPAVRTAPAGRLVGRPAVLRPGVAADALRPASDPAGGAAR